MISLPLPSYYPKNHGQDLTDWFVRHNRSIADLNDLLAHAVVVEKPKAPEFDIGVLRFFKGRKFMPALLANTPPLNLMATRKTLPTIVQTRTFFEQARHVAWEI